MIQRIHVQKDKLLEPVLTRIPLSVTPNHLTLIRIVLAIPLWFLLVWHQLVLALVVFTVAALLDLIDGPLARYRHQVTELGKILDPLADKVIVLVAFLTVGTYLVPLSLFATILVLEIVVTLGSTFYASLMWIRYRIQPKVQANIFGQWKMFLYSTGFILLVISVAAPVLYMISIYLLWIGVMLAVVSGVSELIHMKPIKKITTSSTPPV